MPGSGANCWGDGCKSGRKYRVEGSAMELRKEGNQDAEEKGFRKVAAGS